MNRKYLNQIFSKRGHAIPGGPNSTRAFAASIAKQTLPSAETQTVNPANPNNVTTKVAAGAPNAPINLAPAMGLPAVFSITIDQSATGGGTGTTRNRVILFDHLNYYVRKNGIANKISAGSVWSYDSTNNVYDSIVESTCKESFHFSGVKITATAVAGATVTAATQVLESLKIYQNNAIDGGEGIVHASPYVSEFQQQSNIVWMDLTGKNSRVDGYTAWDYYVVNGLSVRFDFFPSAVTID